MDPESSPGITARRGDGFARRLYISGVAEPLYNRDILRLAAAIPHLGPLAGAQGRAERSSPVCGSRVAVEVALDEGGRVAALGQEVKACALGQASAALMGAHAIGRSPAELAEARDSLAGFLAGRRDDPGAWPGLGLFAEARRFPARHASILLAFEAAAAAAGEAASAR
jgi:NifU-like protein involved in Fe-S cluster formation